MDHAGGWVIATIRRSQTSWCHQTEEICAMGLAEEHYARLLGFMESGGVSLDVFVTRSIRVGGLHENMATPPFVGIGPNDREGSEECAYFGDAASVDAFIQRLRQARDEAFGARDAGTGRLD